MTVGTMKNCIAELADRWRAEAALLERCGAPELAKARLICAYELDAAIERQGDEVLNQMEAAALVGVSPATIPRWEREGRIVVTEG